MNRDWPFSDPPNLATFSLRDIMEGRRSILYVSHDADGDWQFTDGRDSPDPDDAVILSFDEVLRMEPTIAELADLPSGWRAWRDGVSEPWQRERAV